MRTPNLVTCFGYLLFIAFSLLMMTSCSKDEDKDVLSENLLIGIWIEDGISSSGFTWIFRANGTCDLIYRINQEDSKDVDNGTYVFDQKKNQIVVTGRDEISAYTLTMNVLSLTSQRLQCTWRMDVWSEVDEDYVGSFSRVD